MNSRNSGHYFSEEAARRYHDYWKNIQFSENSIKKGKERFEIFTSSLKPGGRILDAGCGSAIYHSHFERAGFSLYGIDSSSEMLKIALEEHPNSIYRKMDITELDFDNNYFDGIWCSGVFLHLSPDMVSKTLNEFRRVLGKKGMLFISTRTDTADVLRSEIASEGGTMEVYYYSENTLLTKLSNSGFKIEWQTNEPDDSGRQFNYMHVLCRVTKN